MKIIAVIPARGGSKRIPLKNITAVDLIKYSPWVDQGDMHNLPYEDNKFDLILCGWVIAYSNNKIKAAEEMTRVGKSGSIIALAATYSPTKGR